MTRLLSLWGPVLGWMAVLFALSAQSSVPAAAAIPDWLTHGVAYALLGLLVARALAGGMSEPMAWSRLALAVALATAYGVSDEYHQAFVPQRESDPYDVAKDFGGACLGALTARWLSRSGDKEIEPR